MNFRPSGPRRSPGRAGTLAATLPCATRPLKRILARVASGHYERDEVREWVLRCIRVELARERDGAGTADHHD
jgi:hypothetical protein